MPSVALTVAGFDPSSGAGITADLAVFAAHGLFGTACITAMTVQSTQGVRSITPVSADLIHSTLEELDADLPPVGIKIGMLATAPAVEALADYLNRSPHRGRVPVVLDPVLRSSSRFPLLDPAAQDAVRDRLLPLVGCVTPNVDELRALLGCDRLQGRRAVEEAAIALQRRGGKSLAVIVTGGDCDEPHDLVLPAQGAPVWLRGERIETTSTHGTGCAFSSALLCALVQGKPLIEAAESTKRYVEEALRQAPGLGRGKGPLAHLWPLSDASSRGADRP